MAKKPTTVAEERRWFDKMNQPTAGVHRLAHAVRKNNAHAFKPAAILRALMSSAEDHFNDFVAATTDAAASTAKPTKKTVSRMK